MKMFSKIFFLFLGLGVAPILLIAIVFSLPYHFQIEQYKNLIGLLLILSTVSTLCLAGLVTRLLKDPIKKLLRAQKEVRHGNLEYRLPIEGGDEFQKLFAGFNKMAEGVEKAAAQEQVLAEQRSFNKLASQVIHDLRSPLWTLKLFAENLDEKNIDPAHLKLFKLSYERLQSIAEDLLAKRKSIAGSTVSLHEMMDHLVLELQAASRYPQLTIEKKYGSNISNIAGEKKDFQRCISNILTNAVEAMGGKGILTLTTSQNNNFIVVEINDNGPGMLPEILEKVLCGNFTHNKINGNGIGMTVVREVVEKYKGELHARSQIGEGTTFQLSFPMTALS